MKITSKRLTFRARFRSFGYAFKGIYLLVRNEPNAWLHFFATMAVLALSFVVQITRGEWIAVLFAIGLVWSAEAMNTAIEALADAVSTEHNPCIGKAKDIAAAAVLFAAITAAVIGLVIFVPYIRAAFAS